MSGDTSAHAHDQSSENATTPTAKPVPPSSSSKSSAPTSGPKKPVAAKPVGKTAASQTPRSKKQPRVAAPTKKPGEQIRSKADLIRKVAGIIKAKGEKPRPAEIARILGEEGITVSPAQVSTTLKAAGYRPLRKRRRVKKRGGTSAAQPAGGTGQTGSIAGSISIDDLLAAKSVAGAFGNADKAIAALQALKRLQP